MIRNPTHLKLIGILPTSIIHVGAHLGQDGQDYIKLNRKAPVIWVEPVQENANKIMVDFPDHIVINKAFWWRRESSRLFHRLINSQNSSLKQPHFSLNGDEIIQVECTTLDIESQYVNLGGRPYLLLDTQGSEYEVLLGSKRTLSKVKFLVIEETEPDSVLYEDVISREKIIALVESYGFRRCLSRPSHDLTYSDVMYVRTSSHKNFWLKKLDALLLKVSFLVHLVKLKHLKSSYFQCDICDS
jgi:FkbM family methyltransferase